MQELCGKVEEMSGRPTQLTKSNSLCAKVRAKAKAKAREKSRAKSTQAHRVSEQIIPMLEL
jgi:hypothetical protein